MMQTAIVAICSLVLFPIVALCGEPTGTLAARIVGQPIAGMPIILELTITNSGDIPFFFWCGGPDSYPPGNWFVADVEDTSDNRLQLRFSNGQYTQGSGSDITLAPGEVIKLPAAMEPLPAGRYSIREITGDPQWYLDPPPDRKRHVTWPALLVRDAIAFEVVENSKAQAAFADDILRRARNNEPFARHLGSQFAPRRVIDALMRDLEATDSEVVVVAWETLYHLDKFPLGLGGVIERAVKRQLVPEYPNWNALLLLGALAERENSDQSLNAVLMFLKDPRTLEHNAQGVPLLFSFPQQRATDYLRQLLKHSDPRARFSAAVGQTLGPRRNSAALPVLIEASADPECNDRALAVYRLGDFSNDPHALPAIQAALHDPETRVRDAANSVIADIERKAAKKKAGKR